MTTRAKESNLKMLYNMTNDLFKTLCQLTYDEYVDRLWAERQNYEHTELTRITNDNITVTKTK